MMLRTFGLLAIVLLLGCTNDEKNVFDVFKVDSCQQDPDTKKLTYKDETREYLIHVPDSYTGNSAVPLFMNFHGFGGSAKSFMKEADLRDIADSEGFILVYPQGSCLDGSPHWNPSLPSPENKSDVDDLGFVEALVGKISTEYNIDDTRVYAGGYSNGAMMAYGLACYKSDLVTAIAAVSGTMLDIDCVPTRPVSLINIHGTDDGVLPYGSADDYNSVEDILNFWSAFNKANLEPKVSTDGKIEHSIYADGQNNTSVEHYRVVDGGHIWFDFSYKGTNTNRLIWNFVSKYDRDGLRP